MTVSYGAPVGFGSAALASAVALSAGVDRAGAFIVSVPVAVAVATAWWISPLPNYSDEGLGSWGWSP